MGIKGSLGLTMMLTAAELVQRYDGLRRRTRSGGRVDLYHVPVFGGLLQLLDGCHVFPCKERDIQACAANFPARRAHERRNGEHCMNPCQYSNTCRLTTAVRSSTTCRTPSSILNNRAQSLLSSRGSVFPPQPHRPSLYLASNKY